MKHLIIIISTLFIMAHTSALANEDGHGHDETNAQHDAPEHNQEHSGEHGGEHDEEGAPIELSPAQIQQAGIKTQKLSHQSIKQSITAPGTVTFNAYNLSDVTTLVDGIIEKRFVRLGDMVKRGQRLLTLNSSALAQAQAEYLRAEGTYRTASLDVQRLEALVKDKIVSEARFQQAQSNVQAAKANLAAAKAALSAYGMRSHDIQSLSQAAEYGQLTLRAPTSGTITADDFRLGQHIAAGSRLMQIADESTVWVEVKLSQHQATQVHAGKSAIVMLKNERNIYPAKVVNVYHQLDNTTRTVGVRLEVQNPEDALHPGMFVTAQIEAGDGEEALLIPTSAVQRQGNELIVFVEEEPGHFERREVEVGKASLGLMPVLSGIKEGENVVVQGAFVLASELAKSGFAVHNH